MLAWPIVCAIATAAWLCAFGATSTVLAAQTESASRAAQAAPGDALAGATDAIPAKVRRYAQRLLHRYDANGDGKLQADESSKMQGQPKAADGNADGTITLEELTNYMGAFGRNRRVGLASPILGRDPGTGPESHVPGPDRLEGEAAPPSLDTGPQSPAGEQPPRATTFHVPKSRRPPGLPDWFARRDLDGDGQLSLAEFAPSATQADLEEHARFDRNGDGFITAKECLDVLKPAGRKGREKPRL